ncbi:FAD-dependent oxidoreductase [Leptolyngbya sp. KIOST-1]|uniref:FAD-dependent oxidoreductase n=1 Tax=Leptolyngbya sp. KIOST-1 TaxID=1229172 RepID=UPI00055C77A1|nr:NAD(P)/FAD-dependent oxidoreductase [Leptolyngbya sp. KIOST-1]
MKENIIIIGGGSGGLALALFLEKAGIKSEIYEQASAFSEAGASYAVHPNGFHVINELDLGEQLRQQLNENSHPLENYKFKDKQGELLFDIRSLVPDSSFFSEGLIYVARHHLIDVLYQAALRKGIPIHFSKRLKNLEQDDKSVTAYFEDGTAAIGSLLIGADGTHSRTRAITFPYEFLRYSGKWAVFGMAEVGTLGEAEVFMDQDYLASYFEEDFNITISKHHPTAKKRFSWVFIQSQERKVPKKHFDEKPVEVFKQQLADKFSDFKEPIDTLILNSSTFLPQQVFNVGTLPKFSFGRVALIGDALQTTDPYSGMGATLSLEDGLYLAKMLRDHTDYEDAFYYYEFDRKDNVRRIHQETKEMEQEIEAGSVEKMKDYFLNSFFLNIPKVYWDEAK